MTYVEYMFDSNGEVLLYPYEAADLVGIPACNIRRYAELGVIGCVKTTGGHRRYFADDIARLTLQIKEQRDSGDRRFTVNK